MTEAKPILFVPEVIRHNVSKDKAGIYVLGDDENGFVPKYVGRSDTSLRKRLLTHNHLYKHSYVIFRYAENKMEAFLTESKWWHDCLNSGYKLDNLVHPGIPPGVIAECPYCAFVRDSKEIWNGKAG